jgi:PAS domain S-box-containing protein
MVKKPTYEELEQRVKELENKSVGRSSLEHALRESQQRLELAVDGANLAMWDWNVDTGKVKYSQRWTEILGYLPEEIKPHVSAWKELVHPEDMPQVMQKLNPNLEGLTSFYECEHRLKTKSGDWKWVLARGKVVERNNDGKPLRHTGTQFDINDRVIAQEALKEARNALEQKVAERTVELVNTNELLKQEIKERKQAEEALRKSEERYRLLADNVTDVIWTRDLNLNLTYISPSIMDQQGFTVEEAMDRTLEESLAPDSLKLAEEVFVEELEIERGKQKDMSRSRTLEVEVKCKDNSTILTEITMSFLRDHDGKPIGIIGVTRNITERKQAEEALRESEEKYRNIISESPIGISIYDATGQCVDANDSIARIVGTTKERTLQQNYNHIESWKKSGLYDKAKSAVEEQSTKRHYLKEKSTFEKAVSLDCYLVPFSSGGLLLMVTDISEQKRAEEAVRESESKFRNLFDLSPQAVALTKIKSGRLVDINNKLCELTKYSKEEILGLNTTEVEFYLEADRSKFLKELQASGEVNGLEMEFKAKDNSTLHALMFARIIQIEGESFILTIFHDITEQKRLEAQLQQSQKMEAMGTLAGGIAHDFNNLLMGIQGRTSLMIMDSDASHSHFEHLKGIEDYVKSAADLTKQLLGFARGGKYEIKPTDLNEFIKKQNRMFGRTRKDINIRGRYEKNLWTTEIDQGQIEQVLLNLYLNSWQAMSGGGGLYIQTENIVIDEFFNRPYHVEPGKYVKISVADTGVGMDKATQQRIFDPFFTTREMGRGTGLGLASAYGIIKNHGGFIDVYSEKGKGSTFNIYLPASETEVVKEKKSQEEVLKGAETTLLVDDEDMIIEVGQGVIKKLGYKVLTAKSGKEAIEIYKKNHDRIDMVLLDMIMPEMGGGETYDKLKEINPGIKVLLSSGYSIDGEATNILERGCNGFIQKPFYMTDLSKKIREILDKE